MFRCARFRVLAAVLAMSAAARALPADGAVVAHPQATPESIVVGFVGGFVSHDNPHHGSVLLARRIQGSAPKSTFVQVFENRRRKTAYKTILRLLDRNHDGVLAEDEKAQARIILFGQSWGAAAVVMLARDLNRAGIPVLLTVQVDSVAKFWQNDRVIPENVVVAANFYQTHGIVHGRPEITAADPARTQILGNYRFDYKKEPAHCDEGSWYDRFFTPSHAQTECDPRLWSHVEDLVRQRLALQSLILQNLEPQPSVAATAPQP